MKRRSVHVLLGIATLLGVAGVVAAQRGGRFRNNPGGGGPGNGGGILDGLDPNGPLSQFFGGGGFGGRRAGAVGSGAGEALVDCRNTPLAMNRSRRCLLIAISSRRGTLIHIFKRMLSRSSACGTPPTLEGVAGGHMAVLADMATR